VLRRHLPFGLVLAAGGILRVLCEIAYRPALFYSDSWGYLSMAHGGSLVSLAPLRPSGYPLVLKILSVAGNGLMATTLVQHVAGLATGVVAYVVVWKLGARRWQATVAGALVVLDAWAIALEQFILADALFGLLIALVMWASLLGTRRVAGRDYALAFAGLCLAGAALMRPVALFAVPAWLAWMAWTRPGRRPALAGILALVVPLLVYSAAHASVTGSFGLTQAEGWFLYGRVGSIATCDGIHVEQAARRLCDRPARAAHEDVSFFIFNRESPARKAFGGISGNSKRQAQTNAILRRFAFQVIEQRPGRFLELVGRDFLKFLRPGPHARYREDLTVEFPENARIRFDDRSTRRGLFAGLKTHASAPAGLLRSYGSIFHTSRPLIALIALLSLVAIVVGIRRRDPLAQAVFLPWAMGLLLLLGSAATAGFALRYLVPTVAEWAVAGTLSVLLLTRAAGRGASQAVPSPSVSESP
jgi:hypothetical protein